VPENRAVIVSMLEPLGFELFQAASGHEGLCLAQALAPDLILMDIVMPDIGGLEVIRRLREIPSCRGVAIIAVSASAGADVQGDAVAAGANAFVAKPVDMRLLMQHTATLLDLDWIERADDSARNAGQAAA